MVSIFFKPDKTQIVTAILKNGKVCVKSATEIESRFNLFSAAVEKENNIKKHYSPFYGEVEIEKEPPSKVKFNTDRKEALAQFFSGLKKDFIDKFDEVYIVLPDELFSVIDCFEFTTEDNLENTVSEIADMSFNDLAVAIPFEATPGQFNKKSVYAMEQEIIDDIIAAAVKSDIPLNSIEAASLSVIRAIADWRTEKILFPIYSTSADIISYSPLGGIFRLETDLNKNYLENYRIDAEEEIRSVLCQRDVAAEKTFKSINLNVPVYVLDNSKCVENISSLNARKGEIKISDCIKLENNSNPIKWIGALGTMLQVLDENSELYATKPPFLRIKSGNLLPENIRVGTRIKRFGKLTKNILQKAVAILGVSLIASLAIFFYFHSIKISSDLQSKYDSAKEEEVLINRDFEILELSKKENYHPVESFITLMKYRPEELKFLNINVGNNSGANVLNDWIKFTVVSKDPILFQNMLSRLREEKSFTNCSLNEINSDTTGFKKANFMLGKGGDK